MPIGPDQLSEEMLLNLLICGIVVFTLLLVGLGLSVKEFNKRETKERR